MQLIRLPIRPIKPIQLPGKTRYNLTLLTYLQKRKVHLLPC